MLKRDNLAFGILLGLVLPGLFYGLLRIAAIFIKTGTDWWTRPFEPDRMIILALAINLLPIRIYFVKYRFEKTGQGVLLVTFLSMLAYFLFTRYS